MTTHKAIREALPAIPAELLHLCETEREAVRRYALQAVEALRREPMLDLDSACIGYARLDGDEYKLAGMRRNPVMSDGQLRPIYVFSEEDVERHQITQKEQGK